MAKHIIAIIVLLISFSTAARTKLNRIEYGDISAPVQIVEYASPSCTVCAEFSRSVFPKLLKKYIQTKKVYFKVINLPYQGIDLKVSALINHSPNPIEFHNFIYQNQHKWLFSKNPIKILTPMLVEKGMTMKEIQSALNNKTTERKLLKDRLEIEKKYQIEAIPFFKIGQTKIVGLMPWTKFEKTIDSALSHVKNGNPLETFGQKDEKIRSPQNTARKIKDRS
ncbi:MAG: thioredoxin domain-containing protein [Alphaproteobacteria bacterium]